MEAARAEFAAVGYGAASLRAIARRAGVDPALVHHYFEDKVALFVEVMQLPGDPRRIPEEATQAAASVGSAVVQGFLAMWDGAGRESGTSFVSVAQAMSASPEAADALREFIAERVWSRVPGRTGDSEAQSQRRRALVASQLIGLAWARYLVRIEPLASAGAADVAAWMGPTIDRYLTDDLGGDQGDAGAAT